jgi:predicted DNA-binding transcriptional regulator AlpA
MTTTLPAAVATRNLLSLDQVLDELGDGHKSLARSTFFRWKATGKAPRTIKYPNGSLWVRRSDLDAWLESLEDTEVAA